MTRQMTDTDDPKRLIAIGDIHGEFRLLVELIERRIVFDPSSDRLVFLGDYIDRGPDSRQVVEYVSALKKAHPAALVLLAGNHESMAADALYMANPLDNRMWLSNGGRATLDSYGTAGNAARALLPFIESLLTWYETDAHIFVHAGVDQFMSMVEMPVEVLQWSRTLCPHKSGRVVVIGHTVHERVMDYGGLVAVDTGAYMTGLLSAYDVLGKTVYTAAR
ncbi:MAG: serine/threonine protein phosphatase [Nitrospirae bacterium]|nr:serine/threonine protein phosphatase [Nitrospirota bacterium]